MSIVKILDCDNADEFLNQLSPIGPVFGHNEAVGSKRYLRDGWVFRGHMDDDYLLIPSAFRGKNAFAKFGSPSCDTNAAQVRAEAQVLRRFFTLADATGLPLPEDSQVLRATIHEIFRPTYHEKLNKGEEIWPPPTLWSLLGIAQHYGIPTRLIDWSRKARVACYFAASDAAKRLAEIRDDSQRREVGETKKLCVWSFALSRYASWFNRDLAEYFGERIPSGAPVVEVTAPHAHNANLHAQDGLFSLQRIDMTGALVIEAKHKPLDEVIQKSIEDNHFDPHGKELFYRFRLNWSEAAELMWRLQQEGIGRANIYPGYQGVVGAIEEESMY
jgi:hypothetical protein